jgi:photosystem II stability/assembly factor-like uncharacterized protein
VLLQVTAPPRRVSVLLLFVALCATAARASAETRFIMRWLNGGCRECDPRTALTEVQWITPQEAWAGALVPARGQGAGQLELLHTVDGARHWRKAPFVGQLWSFFFLNRERGWVQWADPAVEFHLGRTTDGGRTWQDRKPETPPYWRMKFITEELGYGITREWEHGSALAVTKDGGATWDQRAALGLTALQVHFASAADGRVLGREGPDKALTLLRTLDGGQKWVKSAVADLRDVEVPAWGWIDSEKGWLLWCREGAGCGLLLTGDGGVTWATTGGLEGHRYNLSAGVFLSERVGVMVGDDGKQRVILTTQDGGRDWASHLLRDGVWPRFYSCANVGGEVWCAMGLDLLKVTANP